VIDAMRSRNSSGLSTSSHRPSDWWQVLLSQADRALGRLDGSIQTLPDPDLFVFMYVRKEAVLSSQIEGTQSSLQDVLAAEAKILHPERHRRYACTGMWADSR
jgi:Fic family protein